MTWTWLSSTVAPLQQLIGFLHKESKSSDVTGKQVLMELRDNLNLYKEAYENTGTYDNLIDLLSNEAYRTAIKENFPFKKIKAGKIQKIHIRDERNLRYLGWTTEKLMDKIDEKIQSLKNLKKLNNGSVEKISPKVTLKLSNLYFRMKLMAEFIYEVKR
ncbi:hypothetical protein [Pollutibacter soli]|uniref:hypothetical protein n=1 Tax=Pollutibacter soli TaxID=3034157 RepID=UPI003013997B